MGYPSALRKMAEAKQKLETERDISAGGDEKVPPATNAVTRNDGEEGSTFTPPPAASAGTSEGGAEDEATPSEPVNEPTFKVTLKTGGAAVTAVAAATAPVPIRIATGAGGYSFVSLPEAKFPGLADKKTRQDYAKWGIRFSACKFRFNEKFEVKRKDAFLADLFSSKAFQGVARHAKKRGQQSPLSTIEGDVKSVESEQLNATVTSMAFFDRIGESEVTSKSGRIAGCYEDVFDGVTVHNRLQKMLVDEDDDDYDMFNDADRDQVIFRLFRHLVFGAGALCQYEDRLDPYLETCKTVYRDLISVVRNKTTGQVDVRSKVFAVRGLEGRVQLFPGGHDMNLCLISVDTIRRYVTYYYSAWSGSVW